MKKTMLFTGNSVPTPLLSEYSSVPNYVLQHYIELPSSLRFHVHAGAWQGLPPVIKIVVHTLATYGLRISELLSAKVCDIGTDDRIYIKGKKKSRNRTIVLKGFEELARSQYNLDIDGRIFGISYAYVYGWMKRCRAFELLPNHEKNSVTSLPRHQLAEEARRIANNDMVQDSLGHKSSRTQEHYGQFQNQRADGGMPPKINRKVSRGKEKRDIPLYLLKELEAINGYN